MKKAWIVIIILLGIFIVGGYAVIDNIFPKAAPINCPSAENIFSITLAQNKGISVSVEPAVFDEFLQNINNAQPTRIMSVNDCPSVKTYYIVEIDTSARIYRYFIYTEHSQVYIEIPYEGVYKATEQLLDFVINRLCLTKGVIV